MINLLGLLALTFAGPGLRDTSVFAQEGERPAAAGESTALPDSMRAETPAAQADSATSIRLPDSLRHRLDRVIPNIAFEVGEKLTFKVRYGFIKAGEATLTVKDIVMVNDSTPAYHIVSTAKSAKAFDLFYKVRDSVETFVDTRGLFSWKYNKHLREGGYKFDLLVDYQQPYGVAYVETIRYNDTDPLTIKERREFEMAIPAYVLDVLASFYFVRTQKLRVGEPLYLSNHDNKKVYDLQVLVQRRERIEVEAGKFDCIVVSPRLQGEGLFQQKGKLWIWVTDDDRKIPVQMSSKIAVGSITSELIRIEGVPLPLKAQVR